jgi:hypothetical protein
VRPGAFVDSVESPSAPDFLIARAFSRKTGFPFFAARSSARGALLVGATLMAIAAGTGARAEVRPIPLDACSGRCYSPAINDPSAETDPADVTLFGGGPDGADDPGFDLILDPQALPTVLVSGLPSPIASADVEDPGARGPSPYDFFEDVISLPPAARAGFATASLFLFAPSLIGRLTVTDVLSASNAFVLRRWWRRGSW